LKGKEELVVAVEVPMRENGVEVGMIEPVAPPEWPRYEVSRNGQPNPGPSPKDHRTEQVRILASNPNGREAKV
jgi:hypothetical protein